MFDSNCAFWETLISAFLLGQLIKGGIRFCVLDSMLEEWYSDSRNFLAKVEQPSKISVKLLNELGTQYFKPFKNKLDSSELNEKSPNIKIFDCALIEIRDDSGLELRFSNEGGPDFEDDEKNFCDYDFVHRDPGQSYIYDDRSRYVF